MRNYFEAVGMVGTIDKKIIEEAKSAAVDCLNKPDATFKNSHAPFIRPYCMYVTRYNAARCMERLHPSGPESYCEYWISSGESMGRNNDGKFVRIEAYAVRGFNKKRRMIGRSTHDAIYVHQKEWSKRYSKLDWKVVRALKDVIDSLGEKGELEREARQLATNVSLALIRWLPYRGENDWLKEKLQNPVFTWGIRSNLCMALWYRGEDGYAEEKETGKPHPLIAVRRSR